MWVRGVISASRCVCGNLLHELVLNELTRWSSSFSYFTHRLFFLFFSDYFYKPCVHCWSTVVVVWSLFIIMYLVSNWWMQLMETYYDWILWWNVGWNRLVRASEIQSLERGSLYEAFGLWNVFKTCVALNSQFNDLSFLFICQEEVRLRNLAGNWGGFWLFYCDFLVHCWILFLFLKESYQQVLN